jgi:hypothetical protein
MEMAHDVDRRPAFELRGAGPVFRFQAHEQPVEFVGFGAQVGDLLQGHDFLSS